jgi:hypothetical protein
MGTRVTFNKTDHHDIAEILLKVALNSINQTKPKYVKDGNNSDDEWIRCLTLILVL